MLPASELLERYGISESSFYRRRKYLQSLGYTIEPIKQGNQSLYDEEHRELFDELHFHIKDTGRSEGFPTPAEQQPSPPNAAPNQKRTGQAKPAFDLGIKLILAGTINWEEDSLYLTCADQSKFRIKNTLIQLSTEAETGAWQVFPSTNSNGEITTITVGEMADAAAADQCSIQGRVIQISKKSSSFLFKIDRARQKALKLSLMGLDPSMRTGQLWQIEARRQGKMLVVETATSLSSLPSPSSPSSPSQEGTNNQSDQTPAEKEEEKITPSKDKEIIIAALKQEISTSDWKFIRPRKYEDYWEWNGYSPSTNTKVRVWLQGKETQIYRYGMASARPGKSQENKDRLTVTPLGAARSIGASCFQVCIGPYEIVLDCGSRTEDREPLPALEFLDNPHLLLLSHAHQDNIGALPFFYSKYPGTRAISTAGTREIGRVILKDGLKSQENEDGLPLFQQQALDQAIFHLETEAIDKDFEPLPGLQVRFINGGHIPGAVCIYLQYGERSLFYTGHFHTSNSRTTTGLKLTDLPDADMLIAECTHGATTHSSRKTQEKELLEAIAAVIKAGGNVLIPTFPLGRGQEILLALRTAPQLQRLNPPIYADGLFREITQVYEQNLTLLPESLQNFARQNNNKPFFASVGTSRITPITDSEQRFLAMVEPSIILASSGRLAGGPSVSYAASLLEKNNTALFFCDREDEEFSGKALGEIQTGDWMELDGRKVTVRAKIHRFSLPTHSDRVGLGQVFGKVNPKHLILVHGNEDDLHEIARSGDNRSKYYIHIPQVGDKIEYGNAPKHLDRKKIAVLEQPQEFELHLENFGEDAWLRVPRQVVKQDPRWQNLAESGVIRAKWDGAFHLRLSAVNPETIRRDSNIKKAIVTGAECCAGLSVFSARKVFCQ